MDIPCLACKAVPSKYTILLCVSDERVYLPNQHVRAQPDGLILEVPFCVRCMKKIENNLRATILYLQSEAGLFKRVS